MIFRAGPTRAWALFASCTQFPDPLTGYEMRALYLDTEQRWLKLAASYEASHRVVQFLGTEPIVKHPVCESCGVATWIIEVRELATENKNYIYQCKICGTQTEVAGK